MEFRSQRRIKLAAAIGVFGGLFGAQQAFADIIPPKNYAMTPGGVNVADGSLQYAVTDLSVGAMKLLRSHQTGRSTARSGNPPFGLNFNSNFNIYISVSAKTSTESPRHLIVHGAGNSGVYAKFVGNNLVGASNKDAEKATLSFDGTRYTFMDTTDGSGTVYTFHPTIQAKGVLWASESRMVERIDFPDGRRQVFSYNSSGNLKLVEDSAGYAMVFDYNTNNDITAACAFNRSQTYVSATSTCASAAMKTIYSYSGTSLLSVTDVMGQITNYTMTDRGMTCLKPPGFSTCAMSVLYSGDRVSTQTLQDGGVWGTWGMSPEVLNNPDANYEGDCTNETSITDPAGATLLLTFTGTSPCWMTDALGYQTSFEFEGAYQYPQAAFNNGTFLKTRLLLKGTDTKAEYLGPFWAISKETMIAKPGSGLASLTTSYGYQGSCTTLPATYQNCVKPIWTRDPKGAQTDFTYASHGGLLTEMKPAPTAGAPRPLKVMTYMQKYAYIKNSGGSLVTAATQIWVPSTETVCQTVAGSSATTCDSTGPRVVTTYQYGAN